MALKNGYARLKVRYEKLQQEYDKLKEQGFNLVAELNDLRAELQQSEQARKNLHKYIDDLLDREAWLFKHSLWIVKHIFVKKFKL